MELFYIGLEGEDIEIFSGFDNLSAEPPKKKTRHQ